MDINRIKLYACGGVASVLAEFGTFPIDTTKSRLQVQGQLMDKKYSQLRYNGMTHAFMKIAREEGIRALYSGLCPALLRQSVYGTMKYGSYYTLKAIAADNGLLNDPITGGERIGCTIICAATAGIISSVIANPTDVLKIRMQVHSNWNGKQQQKNIWWQFYDIYKYEGVNGLWRGATLTAQRAVLVTSVDLPLYDYCKSRFTKSLGDQPLTYLISSLISSFGVAVATSPIEVIRTRLMNQKCYSQHSNRGGGGGGGARIDEIGVNANGFVYSGSLHCAKQTVRGEGLKALYKGFIPAWMRMGPWNAIFFVIYEELKHNCL